MKWNGQSNDLLLGALCLTVLSLGVGYGCELPKKIQDRHQAATHTRVATFLALSTVQRAIKRTQSSVHDSDLCRQVRSDSFSAELILTPPEHRILIDVWRRDGQVLAYRRQHIFQGHRRASTCRVDPADLDGACGRLLQETNDELLGLVRLAGQRCSAAKSDGPAGGLATLGLTPEPAGEEGAGLRLLYRPKDGRDVDLALRVSDQVDAPPAFDDPPGRRRTFRQIESILREMKVKE